MELNDTVTVTLTKRGAEILNEQAKSLNARYNMGFKDNYMAGDDYQSSLWSLFDDFGEACSAGSEFVFTNLRRI